MPFPDLALIALYGLAFIFSIIEMGISAWAVSLWSNNRFTRADAPSEYGFLLFASLWTMVVIPILGLLDIYRRDSWLGMAVLVVNFVTWVFWLSGFAALAAFFGGSATGAAGALLAFAVMLWLIFTAILVLNALTAFSVLRSERHSHAPVFSRDGKVSRPVSGGPSMSTA